MVFYIINSPKLLNIKWWHIMIMKLIIIDNYFNYSICSKDLEIIPFRLFFFFLWEIPIFTIYILNTTQSRSITNRKYPEKSQNGYL